MSLWNQHAGTQALITIIAATNEPQAIDLGFLRPGRFDRVIFVGPLDAKGRFEFFYNWYQRKLYEHEINIMLQNNYNNNSGNNSTSTTDSTTTTVATSTTCGTITATEIENLITILVTKTELYTGADLTYLLKRACFYCLLEFQNNLKLQLEGKEIRHKVLNQGIYSSPCDSSVNKQDNNNNNSHSNAILLSEVHNAFLMTHTNNNVEIPNNNLKLFDKSSEQQLQVLLPKFRHFEKVFESFKSIVTPSDIEMYQRWQRNIK